jgi:hypothetical protein
MDPILLLDEAFWDGTPKNGLNASQIEFIQDANLMTLILQMATRLSGQLTALLLPEATQESVAEDSEGFRGFRTRSRLFFNASNSNGRISSSYTHLAPLHVILLFGYVTNRQLLPSQTGP